MILVLNIYKLNFPTVSVQRRHCNSRSKMHNLSYGVELLFNYFRPWDIIICTNNRLIRAKTGPTHPSLVSAFGIY